MSNAISRICVFVLAAAAAAGSAFGQIPAVAPGGIVNHFSYAKAGLPNAGIAQGSIFDIYGSNIGPEAPAALAGFPIPTVIANTSVQVTVSATTVDVYLFFVSATQLVGVLPSRTPIGGGTLTVTVNGQQSAPAPIQVVARSIGILSLNQAGHGAAAMQMPDGAGNLPLNSLNAPITPLGVGVLYGTGAGAVTFDETIGAPLEDLGPDIHALVDGKEARLLYKGRAPGFVGLDQFNIEIPAGVSGCYVPVAFRTANVISNYTTISVAPNGACPDPKQPPPTSGIDRAGTIRLDRGTFELDFGENDVSTTSDLGEAQFVATDFSKVTVDPALVLTQVGPCIVQPLSQVEQPPDENAETTLDAGAFLTLTGPNGEKRLDKIEAGSIIGYGGTLGGGIALPGGPAGEELYLVPGTYGVTGAGGGQVGSFQASLTIPQEFDWTNRDISTIERAQGVELTWTGGDPNSVVIITGSSSVPDSAAQPGAGYHFRCTVPVAPGRYTVPPEVLLTLPASVIVESVSTGALSVATITTPVPFTADGIERGEFAFSSTISAIVQFN
jgi:uncharacterized protein (TIGR03437 family)